MGAHNEIGKKGEELAGSYLEKKGYKILDRNWRFGKEELDLVARKSEKIIFVEVKARTDRYFGDPEEFVTLRKQKHLIKAANAYLELKDIDLEAQFDVIGVIIAKGNHHITHIEDAFQPIA